MLMGIFLFSVASLIAGFILSRAFKGDSNYKLRAIVVYPDKPIIKKVNPSNTEFTIKRLGSKRIFFIIKDAIKHNVLQYSFDNSTPLKENEFTGELEPISDSKNAMDLIETTILTRLAQSKLVQAGLIGLTIVGILSFILVIFNIFSTQTISNKVDELTQVLNQTKIALTDLKSKLPP